MTELKTKTRTAVRTRAEFDRALQQANLPALEDSVLRMRYGIAASEELVLQARGQDNPETAAALQQIEARAVAMLHAAPDDPAIDAGKRNAIIERLRRI